MRKMTVLVLLVFAATLLDLANAAEPDLGPEASRARWKDGAIVIFEVKSVTNPKTVGQRPTVLAQPLGTLSGPFDAGEMSNLEIWLPLFSPQSGDICLAEVRCDNVLHQFTYYNLDNVTISSHLFMPSLPSDVVSTVGKIRTASNKEIETCLARIRDHRRRESELEPIPARSNPADDNWASHSLVYGVIRPTAKTPSGKPSLSVDLNPLVTLSGKLDCGLTPKLALDLDQTLYPKQLLSELVGANVLVLLEQKGKVISIAKDFADFMPADHAPICKVASFEDPRVLATRKNVQESRAKEYARALAATPLAGKKATISWDGSRPTTTIEFLSETKAVMNGKEWDDGRLGESFRIAQDFRSTFIEGTILGDRISGKAFIGPRTASFKGTLR